MSATPDTSATKTATEIQALRRSLAPPTAARWSVMVVLSALACAPSPHPAPPARPALASELVRANEPRVSAATGSDRSRPPGAPRWAPFGWQTRQAADACARFALEYCARADGCSPVDTRRRYGTVAACAERAALWCTRELAAPDTGFSLESLSACGREVAERPCGRWRLLEDLPARACHPQGQRADRAPCFSDAQCSSGFCARTRSASEGLPSVCGACAPVVSVGDTCAGPSLPFAGCPLGARCSRGLCIGPYADEGEPCAVGAWFTACYGTFPDDTVDTHLDCDLQSARPLCRRGRRPSSCADGPHECWNEDHCNVSTGRCEPRAFVGVGERCDPSLNDCAGGPCEGTCTAPQRAGEPCTPDDECAWPASCVEGACLVLDPRSCDEPLTE